MEMKQQRWILLFFLLFQLCLQANIIEARRFGSFRGGARYYGYYGGGIGGESSSTTYIITGSIVGGIAAVFLIVCLIKRCQVKKSERSMKTINIQTKPEKIKFMLKKKTIVEGPFQLAESSDDSDSRKQGISIVSRNNEKAKLSLQKRTFSDPIMRVHSVNYVTDSVKKKNVTRAVYVVARTYGKLKSVTKKRTPIVSDIGKAGAIPETPPPPYEELEYKPRIPSSPAQSGEPAYPPMAFNYGY